MKKLCSVLLAVCLLLGLCACGSDDAADKTQNKPHAAADTQGETQEQPYAAPLDMPYVGIILKSTDNPYFSLIKAGAEDEADALGVQVMVVSPDSETDSTAQATLLNTMANMAVDVIAIAPSDEETLTDGLERAVENGKIVISVDSCMDFEDSACYIGTDQYSAAYQQGAYAAKLVEETENANAIILRGAEGDKTHTLRQYGIEDGLHDGNAHVLDVEVCNSSEEEAAACMEELLEEYGDLNVVCTTNDSMAVGAQRAIAEAGRDIHIVSFDGMQETTELVRVGEIDATFAQDAYEMGRQCIQCAVKLYQGEEVESSVYTDVTCIEKSDASAHLDEISRRLKHQGTK
ncbi:MAG: sugar ABC transporter substrate-binding protein [Eubacteriales bacterium]|nr:sugar ABC transporter substrate-binding protein [Eubacteriales bacterium]